MVSPAALCASPGAVVAQSKASSIFRRQRQGFIEGIGVQRLTSAQHCCERLQRDTRNIVHRLLSRQGHTRCLCVEPHQPRALVLRAEPIFHHPIPDLACGAVFRNFLEEVVVRVEKETEPRTKFVHIQPAPPCPLHILDAVIQRESQLLQRRRARLADVISADRNRVKSGREFCSSIRASNAAMRASCAAIRSCAAANCAISDRISASFSVWLSFVRSGDAITRRLESTRP